MNNIGSKNVENCIKSDVESLHNRFKEYGANAKEWLRKCVLMLPEIEKYEVWKKKGFSDIYDYTRKLAGMSSYKVDEGLRILKLAEGKPALRKVAEKKGIHAIRSVVTIATKETDKFWAEKAEKMSKHSLEKYVNGLRIQGLIDESGDFQDNMEFRPGTDFHSMKLFGPASSWDENIKMKVNIMMQLDREIFQQLEKLKGNGEWNDLMKRFLKIRDEKLEERKPEPVAKASRNIPVKIQKYILNKTNSKCAFPGCKKPYEIFHHTKRYALSKIHDPNFIVPLCKAHERLFHLGLIENEEMAPKHWKIRKQPDTNHPKHEIDKIVTEYRSGFV